MREQFRMIPTNLTPVRVVGVPGLTLVFIAIALAVQFPEARWLIFSGLCGGAVIATVLVLCRRSISDREDGLSSGGVLLIDERPPQDSVRRRRARNQTDGWRVVTAG